MAGAEAGAGVGAWGGCAASPQNNTTANSLDDIMSEQLASHLQRKEDIRFAKNTAAAHNILQDENTPAKLVQQLQTGPESEFCDSDLIIAKMLQCQFDQEYKDQVKNSEKKRNGLYKYKIPLEHSVQEAEEDTVQREYERDWDNFDDNEKDFAEIPRCGYKLQDGKMVTKHDTTLTGRRNASKVMAFPPEFRTGDAAAFDMQLPNRVFNSLKAHSRSEQSKKNKMLNRKESHATAEMGIDEPTRLLLYKFINNGMLQSINGIIATGKESIVLHAEGDPSYPEKLIPSECAIKVFKTTLNEFKTRDKYIKDDYRFKDRFCKLNPRKVIHMWAEKEMHNLMRMQKLGINCPEVICLKKHILILSFIGKDNMAAQKIKEAKLTDAQWILAYEEIVEAMNKMYNEGHLIHADLSEYNILWHKERCWFIDVSQSVEPNHPSGLEFLLRDCTNISHFFSSKGVPGVKSAEELFEHITGIEGTDLSQLERMRYKGPPAHKLFPTSEGEQEEVKPPTYPFDYAWEKSQHDKKYKTKDNIVHHDGLRDNFDELWNKSQISKSENIHEDGNKD